MAEWTGRRGVGGGGGRVEGVDRMKGVRAGGGGGLEEARKIRGIGIADRVGWSLVGGGGARASRRPATTVFDGWGGGSFGMCSSTTVCLLCSVSGFWPRGERDSGDNAHDTGQRPGKANESREEKMGFGRAAEEGKDLPDTPTIFLLYCEVSGCLDFLECCCGAESTETSDGEDAR